MLLLSEGENTTILKMSNPQINVLTTYLDKNSNWYFLYSLVIGIPIEKCFLKSPTLTC